MRENRIAIYSRKSKFTGKGESMTTNGVTAVSLLHLSSLRCSRHAKTMYMAARGAAGIYFLAMQDKLMYTYKKRFSLLSPSIN